MIRLQHLHVTLTDEELKLCKRIGIQRNVEAQSRDYPDKRGSEDGENSHVVGALGELVFGKCLGIVWSQSINTWKKPDYVVNELPLEIRTTKWRSQPELPFRPDDVESRYYILVTQEDEYNYTLCGWCTGTEARNIGVWKDPGRKGKPAWFVHKNKLHSIQGLIDILNAVNV